MHNAPKTSLPLLSYGFRPFFFFGALYAALNILIWLPHYLGQIELPIFVEAKDWHAHELLFGVVPAIVAGFLLTAVPNWTGRLPVRGTRLLILFLVWCAGRVAFNLSATLGLWPTLLIDCSFLLLLLAAIAIEIIAGKNWRNLKVAIVIGVYAVAHLGFYFELATYETADISLKAALSIILVLIMIIGGRIIPSFTRNWLNQHKQGRLPIPFSAADKYVLGISSIALLAWSINIQPTLTATLLAIASVANLWRMIRWAGDRILFNPLLLVLHIAFLFIPIGFAVLALAQFGFSDINEVAGIHTLSIGAIAGMMLGVMARATLGHTGGPLEANWACVVSFAMIFLSAIARLCAEIALFNGLQLELIHFSQITWISAFLLYAVSYGPRLWQARK